MQLYKGIFVAKGSALAEALEKDQKNPDNAKATKKIFEETTSNFQKLYGKNEDWKWFMTKHNEGINISLA